MEPVSDETARRWDIVLRTSWDHTTFDVSVHV